MIVKSRTATTRTPRRLDGAYRYVERALRRVRLSTEDPRNLGAVLANRGRLEEAVALWERSLRLEPDNGEIQAFIASVEATMRQK